MNESDLKQKVPYEFYVDYDYDGGLNILSPIKMINYIEVGFMKDYLESQFKW